MSSAPCTEAQLAIAREHGLPSWTALKEHIGAPADPPGAALAQLHWVIARFRDSGGLVQANLRTMEASLPSSGPIEGPV